MSYEDITPPAERFVYPDGTVEFDYVPIPDRGEIIWNVVVNTGVQVTTLAERQFPSIEQAQEWVYSFDTYDITSLAQFQRELVADAAPTGGAA